MGVNVKINTKIFPNDFLKEKRKAGKTLEKKPMNNEWTSSEIVEIKDFEMND